MGRKARSVSNESSCKCSNSVTRKERKQKQKKKQAKKNRETELLLVPVTFVAVVGSLHVVTRNSSVPFSRVHECVLLFLSIVFHWCDGARLYLCADHVKENSIRRVVVLSVVEWNGFILWCECVCVRGSVCFIAIWLYLRFAEIWHQINVIFYISRRLHFVYIYILRIFRFVYLCANARWIYDCILSVFSFVSQAISQADSLVWVGEWMIMCAEILWKQFIYSIHKGTQRSQPIRPRQHIIKMHSECE